MSDITITGYTGDSIDIESGGRRYRVSFAEDRDTTPYDADCYSPEDIESWKDNHWHYAGVTVTPLDVPESVRFELSDSLWGVDRDFPLDPPVEHDGHVYMTTGTRYMVDIHPVPELISIVAVNVREYELTTAVSSYVYS